MIRAKRAQKAASSLELAGAPSLFIQSVPPWRLAVIEQAAAGWGPAMLCGRGTRTGVYRMAIVLRAALMAPDSRSCPGKGGQRGLPGRSKAMLPRLKPESA